MLTRETNIRYDIVFLRCIAVLAVVCFHFKLFLFREGYAGVDVFFVLSGFLMTQIISEKIQNDTFNLWDFYFRRLARILPALLAVILFFLVLVYAVLGIKLYDFSRFALASSLFISNIYYYQASGYFAPSSQLNWLLHTWSLSIEWQFYMLYPLCWLGFRKVIKRRSKASMIMLYTLSLLSFCCLLFYLRRDQSFAFYMFPTRAWELLVGGLAFFHGQGIARQLSLRLRNLFAILLLIVLVLAMCGIIRLGTFGWPSLSTLLPVGCTVGVLLLNPEIRFFKQVLPVFIARISYSWYLWHWPIVVLCTYFAWGERIEQRLFFFILSMLVSSAAYFFVETRAVFRKPRVLIAGLLTTAILTFTITQISLTTVLPRKMEASLLAFQRTYPVEKAPEQYNFSKGHLLANAAFESFDQGQLHHFSATQENYLLLGDCHAGMFSSTIRRLAAKHQVNLLQATGDETFPVSGIQSAFVGPTQLMNYMYETYLPENVEKIDKVIVAANYAGYSKKQLTAYLDKVERFFAARNVPVVYIGQTESYRIEFPVVQALQTRFGVNRRAYLEPTRYYVNAYLKRSKIAKKYIDVFDQPFIHYGDARQTYFYDADHLSFFGTEQYATLLENSIFLNR